LTLSEVSKVSGEEGNFEVELLQHPRYIDMDKCIACGACAEKCPAKVNDEYNLGLAKRKAAYVKYSQAVPLKYAIDPDHCIYLKKGKCRACEKFCPTNAINFEDRERTLTIRAGAVVLAPGFEPFNPAVWDVYGYAKLPNVLTSLEFERMLSASGPFQGHVIRPSDKKDAKKIAWLQCVGSRDVHSGAKSYCSSVCCTYAIKEAMVAKEHIHGLDAAIFYIDIRTHGKDFERYYIRAKERAGVRFIKSRISSIQASGTEGDLLVRYIDEQGKRVEEIFDLVVLSVGLCMSPSSVALAGKLGLKLDEYGFPRTDSFHPVESSRPGIFVCGAYQGPKDIPSSVIDASAAAGAVGSTLSESRGSLARSREIPAETDVRGEPPRIGVFVCNCGINIGGVVNVPAVAEYARSLPYVAYVEENLFSCSQDTQDKIAKVIKEECLNRVVVAACTPRTHEPLFQETLINAGLNKYLFEMANIRNQCSWVHAADHEAATEKSKDLVRMAVMKAALLQPLAQQELGVNQAALVVGGGLAGLTACKTLADQGYHAYLVERSTTLGGQARNLRATWDGEDIQRGLDRLVREVESNQHIDVYLGTEIKQVDGFVGNFKTTIEIAGEEKILEHGAAILATGASEFNPEGAYSYGEDPRVITGLELDRKLMDNDSSLQDARSAVFLQCVGSRTSERPYCSKVCCAHSIENALALKEINPDLEVTVVHRDIRSYGLREDLYRRAREAGVRFLRYVYEEGFSVSMANGSLKLRFTDQTLGRPLELGTDLLVLAAGLEPPKKNPLAQHFKVPLNDDGFFVEAHVKLRPVDFATDGVFVCGTAHAPKPVDETIAQAQAAAGRAVTILSSSLLKVGGVVAHIQQSLCTGCMVCVTVCPYQAIQLDDKGKAVVNEALCKGCGNCAASCRSGAPSLKGFTDAAIFAQIESC